MTTLETRIVGSLLTDTPIFWSIVVNNSTTYLDFSSATFTVTAVDKADTSTTLWTKTTGFTGAVGTATIPSLTIAWTNADLGALVGGKRYRLRLTCTINGSKPIVHDFDIQIDP